MEGFAFFVGVEYEKLPLFCSTCQNIGHSLANYKKNSPNQVVPGRDVKDTKKATTIYV